MCHSCSGSESKAEEDAVDVIMGVTVIIPRFINVEIISDSCGRVRRCGEAVTKYVLLSQANLKGKRSCVRH